VEPIVVDRDSNERVTLIGAEYCYPWTFEPGEIDMTPLPDFHAEPGKNVLILSSEDAEDLCASWCDYQEGNIFIDWLMGPRDTDMILGATCLSGGYVAMLVKPKRAEAFLLQLSEAISSYLKIAVPSKKSVRDNPRILQQAWRLQRAARGDLKYMSRAAYVFGMDTKTLKSLMRSATVATDLEWEIAYEEAERYFQDV